MWLGFGWVSPGAHKRVMWRLRGPGTIRSMPSGNGHHLWRRVDRLIDRAPTEEDLRSHRLEVLAARRFREIGRPVPTDFAAKERFAAVVDLSAPLVLERVRSACDGPMIVLKGPEVAAFYEDSGRRGYGDIDLLVPDAARVHRALLARRFELVGDPNLYVDIHHLRPVLAPGTPLPIEIHTRPKWIDGASAPPLGQLFESAVPSATGVDGMLTLPPEQQALLLAVHSWAHEPLRHLRDIVDIAAVSVRAEPDVIRRLAKEWKVDRLWRATVGVLEAVLDGSAPPRLLGLWAQNLFHVRERTVLENHLERWLSDFWVMSPGAAITRMPATFMDEVRPSTEESWYRKFVRGVMAIRNAARRRSDHHRRWDEWLSQSHAETKASDREKRRE
jgi:Uncharacterised nucleotidyltransferase